eukprot:m.35455 g.35455  ORF g.35455 m.35455 type:complete len:409 (+) comp32123_c0_seq2:190-1416(+)
MSASNQVEIGLTEGELAMRTDRDAERATIVANYDRGREEGAQIDQWEDPNFEVYMSTDRYGFLHKSRLTETHYSDKYLQHEREREKKWGKMLTKWDKYESSDKLRKRIFKGVPSSLRPLAWQKILGLDKVKKPKIYEAMKLKARKMSPDIRQIDLDVNRTYRDHIMFRERYNVKQQALFHILAAYSMYNEAVGYCQGMSGIAALMLMYLNEEEAFWALVVLLKDSKYTMHGYFVPGLPKLLRSFDHHKSIRKKYLPKLHKHLIKEDIEPSLYGTKWFLQCFLDKFPFSLTLRLWDVYLYLGEVVITAMSYGALKMHQKDLLKLKFEDAVVFLQSMAAKDYDDDKIMVEVVQSCIEELRRARLEHAPIPENEKPPEEPKESEHNSSSLPNGSYEGPQTSGEEDDPETAI